MPNVLRK